MTISISVDNDRSTLAIIDPLLADESGGSLVSMPPTAPQVTGTTADDGDEINVTLTAPVGGALGGFTTDFNTFLNSGAVNLSDAQKVFARDHDGAVSETDFIKVVADAGETINNLQFVGPDGLALNGDKVEFDDDNDPMTAKVAVKTLDGQEIFLYSDGTLGSSSDYAIAATKDAMGNPDQIVAAFHLYGETLNSVVGTTKVSTAGVEMVTFEPLFHPNAANPDDPINWTDVLRVGGSATLSFKFDDLKPGNFLWMALGNDTAGLLVTGQDLDVVDSGGNKGERKAGGTDPSDSVNTSAAGKDPTGTIADPSTIGVNSQHFASGSQGTNGPVAVFTVVTGYDKLAASNIDPHYPNQAFGIDVDDITYDNYINPTGGEILISQTTGSDPIKMSLALWEAGGGAPATGQDDDQLTSALKPEIGFDDISVGGMIQSYSYIGPDHTTERHLKDDTPVNVGTVTIGGIMWSSTEDGIGAGLTKSVGGINVKVSINGNVLVVEGDLAAGTFVKWTTLDNPAIAEDGTFNRFTLQALNGSASFDVGGVNFDQGVPISQALGDKLFVEDDGPTLSGMNFLRHVDEDNLGGSGAGDGSLGRVDTPDDGDGVVPAGEQDEVTFSNSDLQIVVNAGTDSPAIFSLNLALANGTAVTTSTGGAVTSKGASVVWKVSGSTIQGVTGSGASEVVIFEITRNDNMTPSNPLDDTFTFDLKNQLDHSSGSGELALVTLDVTPAFRATDGDLDPVAFGTARPINVEVENDTPDITAQIQNGAVDFVVGDKTTVSPASPISLNGAIGADDNLATNLTAGGVKTYTFDAAGTGLPTNVFPNMIADYSSDNTIITFYSDATKATALFRITLDQTANSGAGGYVFEVLAPPPQQETNFGFGAQPSGQNLFGIIPEKANVVSGSPPNATLPDGGLLFFNKGVHLDPNGKYISGNSDPALNSSTVNTSKGGGAVSIGFGANNYTADGQDAFFIFAGNPNTNAVSGLGLTAGTADDADTVDFNGLNPASSASVDLVKLVSSGESAVSIKAWNLNPNDSATLFDIDSPDESRSLLTDPLAFGGANDDAVQVDIKAVMVTSIAKVGGKTVTTLEYSAVDLNDDGDFLDTIGGINEVLVDTNNVDVTGNIDRSITVTGMDTNKNYTIRYDTESPHDMAEVIYEAGSYNIGGFNIIRGNDTPDQMFDFAVKITDYDGDFDGGDSLAFANFSVLVDGTGVNNDPMVG